MAKHPRRKRPGMGAGAAVAPIGAGSRTRRFCAGDPYAGDLMNTCAREPAGVVIFFGIVNEEDPRPVQCVVASCLAHRLVVEDWCQRMSVSDGLWAPIEALDDPKFVAELVGEDGEGFWELTRAG